MAITASIQEFLRQANVAYRVVPHLPAYTAREEAAVAHVPRRDWAKTVICFADGEAIEAVVPADRVVNLKSLAAAAGAWTIRLAREDELDSLFPDCEAGAMPPFGPLYQQPVFVDQSLAHEDDEEHIVFNAGTHTDAVAMRYRDFAALTHPIVARIGQRRPADRFELASSGDLDNQC